MSQRKLHPMLPQFLQDAKAGKISRREFLSYASTLGVTAAAGV